LKSDNKLGFIVTMDGISVYHAGDTDAIPEMRGYRCDVALLPVSGTYVMSADEAAEAAVSIGPKSVVPMHYGDIIGSVSDAKRLQMLLKGRVEVDIMKKGA
jgi:L-ascorbate metabolism protein UlaG (beta-lactamase superfamily)